MDAVEDFAFQNFFVDNEENDEDEDTTSGDDGEKDDSFNRIKKKLHKVRNLEKLNMFMEENAPFPENLLSPKKSTESVKVTNPLNVRDDLKENSSSGDEKGDDPSSIMEAFKKNFGKAGSSASRNITGDSHEMFTSSRPQASMFQYGKGTETNTITQSDTKAMEEKEKDSRNQNEKISSETILKTMSSDKLSLNDQKRKKGSSSPESNVSVIFKQDDKKLKYVSDSLENKMCDTTDSEGQNKEKE